MSNVAKLKKKAAEFELKKDFAKALAVYVEILDNFDQYAAELDVSLFNRVGDLMLRQGNVADAVDYYERAVVRYVDGGFYNNAIALCNKILRHSPGRAMVYYTLGKISAHKGFTTDAKQNFLEYADRMQKAGKLDEAFRALKEFADLCPGQDDIRVMLSEQLSKLGRKDEAIEQLQLLYARYESEGRAADAQAVVQRMKAIDPAAQPRADAGQRESRSGDLVFLDLGDLPPARGGGAPARSGSSPPPAARKGPGRAPPPSAVADLPLLDAGLDDEEEAPAPPPGPAHRGPAKPAPPAPSRGAPAPTRASGPQRPAPEPEPPNEESQRSPDSASILGLEPTSFAAESPAAPSAPPPAPALDIEPTALGIRPTAHHKDSIIEQEASASLLPEDDMLDPSVSDAPEERFGESSAPAGAEFMQQTNDPLGLDISHDSSSLHIDLPPSDSLSSEDASYWQSETSQFEIDQTRVDNDPPLLRSDALGFDQGMIEGVEGNGAGPASGTPLIDFDTSALESGLASSGQAPPSLRRATISAERSVQALQAEVQASPDNWTLRRELAEAMLESGDREGGVRELEAAMMGAERADELDLASSLAEEIARLAPDTVRFHQKRVEYAFRTNDKLRLIEAYLALAGALLNSQQAEKARAVYQRVLDLSPQDIRAQAALESLAASEPPPPPPEPGPRARKGAGRGAGTPSPVRTRGMEPPMPGEAGFVNLGELLRGDDNPKSTRMIVEEEEPTGDEEADFADMLKKFKQGIAENVDKEDYQSHYDLGVAFKEMGLLDEAVAEFQKALRAPTNRLPTYEALGQCFIEKDQFGMAATVLARALNEKGYTDDDLVGVLYLLGRASEALNRYDEALSYYQRVVVVDIEFRDTADRIAEVGRIAR